MIYTLKAPKAVFTAKMKEQAQKVRVQCYQVCSNCGKLIKQEEMYVTKLGFNVRKTTNPSSFYTEIINGELCYIWEDKRPSENCLLG